jgi:hypothetical protein
MAKLLLTDEHIAQMRGNKAVGFIEMHPLDFLRLTATPITASAWSGDVDLFDELVSVKLHDKTLQKESDEILNNEKELNATLKSLAAEILPLSEYNKFAIEGSNILPPFIKVDMETGKVHGHEGRHRAAALYRADPEALMWVAVILTVDGYAKYYDENRETYKKTYLDTDDIPLLLTGEFMNTKVEIDPRENEVIELWVW